MGIVADLAGGFFESGRSAADDAADYQAQYGTYGIEEQREQRDKSIASTRRLLSPYSTEGARSIGGLGELVSDPEAQRQFIEDNPFYEALAGDATRRLFANQAARGKVGSGSTAEALQNSLVLLGDDLLTSNVNRRLAVGGQGLNAATNEASLEQTARLGTAANISDLYTQIGNARAAGEIGTFNVGRGEVRNLENTSLELARIGASVGGQALGGAALSDVRAKEDLKRVGTLTSGLPVYQFRYKNGDGTRHVGVLAQDAERLVPDAVFVVAGLKYVDYDRLAEAFNGA